MKIESYKLKNGETRYEFQIYLGVDNLTGKKKKTYRRGFKTKQEARRKYIELLENNDLSNKVSFMEVFNEWWEIYKLTVKESTANKTLERFRLHIFPTFQNSIIENVEYKDVQKFTINLSNTLKSFKIVITYLSQIFNHAIRLGVIKTNPCDLIIYPKVEKQKKEIPIWTEQNIKDFLFYAKKEMPFKWYVYFYLIIITGARRGEILALNWKDIYNDKIVISKTVTTGYQGKMIDKPKTNTSNRTLIINNEAIELLKELRKRNTKLFGVQEIVFTTLTGDYNTLSTPIKHLQKVIKTHNIPYMTVHGLRHTITSLMDKEGVKGVTMQSILGHSNQAMTKYYTHSYEEEKRKAANKISDLIG